MKPGPFTHVTESAARFDANDCVLDRKFHTGLCNYVEHLDGPLVCVVPEAEPDGGTDSLDLVRVARRDMPYELVTVRCDVRRHVLPSERWRVRSRVAESRLAFGYGLGMARHARSLGVPHVVVVEHNLRIMLDIARLLAPTAARRVVRDARELGRYGRDVRDVMGASAVHCNGYPSYDGLAWANPNRLLYFDSRLYRDHVITERALEQRLSTLGDDRPLRILHSGRYEPYKGALHVIETGLELIDRGMSLELHTYGAGSLGEAMRSRVHGHPTGKGQVHVHDSVPYPELQEIAKGFDVLLLCHRQGDPSCTYVESMGCGLPIVAYENAMWTPLAAESGAGVVVHEPRPAALADAIEGLVADPARLGKLSRRARTFAHEHCFDHEFARRAASLIEMANE